MANKTILITGGSGLIGTYLTDLLTDEGNTVNHLSRSSANDSDRIYQWDIAKGQLDMNALEGVEGVVHLAGAGVADARWTDARKREILNSRTESSKLLYESIKKLDVRPKVFVSASAVGYYGFDTGAQLLEEGAAVGDDFLADVVKQWEASVDEIASLGVRVVKLRIGIVLAAEGGALPKITQPIRLFAGAPLGTGKQYMSWIHAQDVARMFQHALNSSAVKGVYNCVGPDPVTNEALTKAVAQAINKPLFLPNVPSFVIKLLFGEMANIVLGGNNVSNRKIVETGFEYQFPSLSHALADLL